MEQGIYNTQPHAKCIDVLYIGREIPTKSDQYPDIVQEPLKAMYNKVGDKRLKPGVRVSIYIYNSGIVVQEMDGKINWFPIQNLYCSAGLIPCASKKGLTFEHLNLDRPPRSKPIFAMVVRQSTDDERDRSSRRVLMCHAFIVDDQRSAKLLISATEQAYRNKNGWNHPMNDRQFMKAKINFTMSRIDEDDEHVLDELKDFTLERDVKLAQQLPSRKMLRESNKPQRSASAKLQVMPPQPSVSPRSAVSTMQRSRSAMVRTTSSRASINSNVVVRHSSMSVPPPHHADNRVIITKGAYVKPKSASVIGFPLSRSSSQHSRKEPYYAKGGPVSNEYWHSRMGPKSRRQWSTPATPKHRRVLASSEPTEPMNGMVNHLSNGGNHLAIIDWDQMLNQEDKKQQGPSKAPEKNGVSINIMRNGRVKVSVLRESS